MTDEELEIKIANTIALFWDKDDKEAAKELIKLIREDRRQQLILNGDTGLDYL